MEPNPFLLLNRYGWLCPAPSPRVQDSPRSAVRMPFNLLHTVVSARGISDCRRLWKPRKLFPPDLCLPHDTHPPWPPIHTHISSMPTFPMKDRSPGWPGTQDAWSPNCWDYKGEPPHLSLGRCLSCPSLEDQTQHPPCAKQGSATELQS